MSTPPNPLHSVIRAAIRTRLFTLTKVDTGALAGVTLTRISATEFQLDRTDGGSYVTDGLSAGDEAVVSGFTGADNNGTCYIKSLPLATRLTALLPFNSTRVLVTEAAVGAVTLRVGLPGGQQQFNAGYKPIARQAWCRESYKGGIEQRRGLTNTFVNGQLPSRTTVRLDFQYILTVFYPANTGSSGLDGMSDALRSVLSPGVVLTYSGQQVTILKSYRQGDVQEPEWASVPFYIRGFAYTLTP